MRNIKISIWILRISIIILSSPLIFLTFLLKDVQIDIENKIVERELFNAKIFVQILKEKKFLLHYYPYHDAFLIDTTSYSIKKIWGGEKIENIKKIFDDYINGKYTRWTLFTQKGIIIEKYSGDTLAIFSISSFPLYLSNIKRIYNFFLIMGIIWLFTGFLIGFLITLPYERIFKKLKKGEIEGIDFLKDFLKKEDIYKLLKTKEIKEREEKFLLISEITSSFLHEIRNSLSSLNAFLSLIKVKDKELEEPFYSIKEEIKNITESLFSFNEIIRTQKIKDLKMVNLKEIVESSVEEFVSKFKEKKFNIKTNLEDIKIYVSPFLVKRAIFNIIKNSYEAISENGNIEIFSKLSDNIISLIIEDDGCGMKDEEIEKAPLPFYTTKPSGLGLGLSFVKKIMELHGGEIVIEKRMPKGLRVILNFKSYESMGS